LNEGRRDGPSSQRPNIAQYFDKNGGESGILFDTFSNVDEIGYFRRKSFTASGLAFSSVFVHSRVFAGFFVP